MVQLGRHPLRCGGVGYLVGDEEALRAGRALDPGLVHVGDGEAPRAGGQLAVGELRGSGVLVCGARLSPCAKQ